MSVYDHPDIVEAVPAWRCPECATLQPEAARCWRCDQPAFACKTCHFYRPSVAADLGACAQDPARTPLPADEIRACWEAAGDGADPGVPASPTAVLAPGLFPESDIAPPAPAASVVREPAPASADVEADRARRSQRPPLEEPGRAAWVEPESDWLVEAPLVEPGKTLETEVQRRRRRWFR